MVEVHITPRIQCDNCNFTAEKTAAQGGTKYLKPHDWGSCRIEGTKDANAYGEKSRIDMTDLCPGCAAVLMEAANKALNKARGGEDNG